MKSAREDIEAAKKNKVDVPTPEEFGNTMDRIAREFEDDPEVAHGKADDAMCVLLRKLGYGVAVDLFEEMTKWYA